MVSREYIGIAEFAEPKHSHKQQQVSRTNPNEINRLNAKGPKSKGKGKGKGRKGDGKGR